MARAKLKPEEAPGWRSRPGKKMIKAKDGRTI